MELTTLSAIEQAKLIRTGQISASELLEATLARVKAADGRPGSTERSPETAEDREKIHAFITICEEEARKKAAAVDKKLAAGEPVGLLAGVPYSAKDMYCTKGIPTSGGSGILQGWKPPYDAEVIGRMDAADAVLFGKTNCDEFAMGGTNETSAFSPLPRNPHDPGRVPGGSSGGSAAAVAAFEGAVSLGTDTGGSIREPASFCGVVGLKPTYGRVSRRGTIAFASSMDTMGPLTRTVSDAAAVLNIIAGFDPGDNTTVKLPAEDYLTSLPKGVKGMRIGLSPDLMCVTLMNEKGDFDVHPVDPEIRDAVWRTASILESQGAEIVENVPMPNTKYSVPAYYVISRIEAYSNLQRYDGLKYGRPALEETADMYDLFTRSRGEGFGFQVKLRILTGLFMSRKEFYDKYYLRAQRARALIRSDYDRIFDPNGEYRLDVLLTPSTPTAAFPFGSGESGSVAIQYADQFTSPMNFAGTPGISFPVGFNSEGLPIGVQAAGYDFCESKILRAAFAVEQALPDFGRML